MSIKRKLATAIATAGLLAGLFGSALVPTANAARVANDTPLVSYTGITTNGGDWDNTLYGGRDSDLRSNKPLQVLAWSESEGGDNSAHVYSTGDDDFSIGYRVFNKDHDEIQTADLTVSSSNPAVVRAAWAYAGDDESLRISCENADLDLAYGATDSVKNVDGVDGSYSDYAGDDDGIGNFYALCIRFMANKSGSAVLTATINGVAMPGVKVVSLGDVDSLTITNNYGLNVIAADNHGTGATFTIVGKDVAGQVINGPDNTLADFDLESWTGNNIDELGTFDGEVPVNADGFEREWLKDYRSNHATHESINQIEMLPGVCVAGDEGKTFDLGFELENFGGDLIKSNALKMTCSGSHDEYTFGAIRLEYTSGAADWAASTVGKTDAVEDDGVIGIYAKVVDADGKPMGLSGRPGQSDATIGYNLGLTYDLDGNGDLNIGYSDTYVRTGSEVMLGYMVPDVTGAVGTVYPVDVTLSNWDANYDGDLALADLVARKTYTVGSSTATIFKPVKTWTKGHTKVVFSVDWGLDCSNASVEFDIEKANGDMIAAPLRRRADANGVAKLVLEKRKTFVYVYATSCTALGL